MASTPSYREDQHQEAMASSTPSMALARSHPEIQNLVTESAAMDRLT